MFIKYFLVKELIANLVKEISKIKKSYSKILFKAKLSQFFILL